VRTLDQVRVRLVVLSRRARVVQLRRQVAQGAARGQVPLHGPGRPHVPHERVVLAAPRVLLLLQLFRRPPVLLLALNKRTEPKTGVIVASRALVGSSKRNNNTVTIAKDGNDFRYRNVVVGPTGKRLPGVMAQ